MALTPGLFSRAPVPLPPITGPVGNGMDNDPADVEAVKRGLHALGYYQVPDYGFTGFIDQATTDAVKRFQEDHGLKQDGWLGKDGETYAAINARLGQLPQGVDAQARTEPAAETPSFASSAAKPASTRINLLDAVYRPSEDGNASVQTVSGRSSAARALPQDQQTNSPLRAPANNNEPIRQVQPGTIRGDQNESAHIQRGGNLKGATAGESAGTGAPAGQQRISRAGLIGMLLTLMGDGPTKAGNKGRPGRVEAEKLVDERRADPMYQEFERQAESEYWTAEMAAHRKKHPVNPEALKNEDPVIELGDGSTPGAWFAEALRRHSSRVDDKRGSELTTLGNRIIAQQCRYVIDNEFVEGVTAEHTHGSFKDGVQAEGDYQREETIKDPNQDGLKGSRRPDLTWKVEGPNGPEHYRAQTQDQNANGTPTDREQSAMDDIRERTAGEIIESMRKLESLDDIEEYTKEARDLCRRIFRKYLKPLSKPSITTPSSKSKPGDVDKMGKNFTS